ncbi:uncharacterized protein LOC111629565 [Centruroides sculpturatus]|uniref:uncharacterized protein LOC111629565 n=1 Tax=Centruroides sculpturatus TaxID=218467 RepID=UPI000C6EC0A4|nr:uncharacterized protein LOC111629565 [Centruroides sculpturatus]
MLAYRLPSEDGVVDYSLQAFQHQPQAETDESVPLEEFPAFRMQTHQSEYSSVAETLLHPGQPNVLQNNPEPEQNTQKEVTDTEADVLFSFETCEVVSDPNFNVSDPETSVGDTNQPSPINLDGISAEDSAKRTKEEMISNITETDNDDSDDMELFSLEDAYVPLTPRQILVLENEDHRTLKQELMSLDVLCHALGIIYEEEEHESSDDENFDHTKSISEQNICSSHQLNDVNQLEQQSFESTLLTSSMTIDIEGDNCIGIKCDPCVISRMTKQSREMTEFVEENNKKTDISQKLIELTESTDRKNDDYEGLSGDEFTPEYGKKVRKYFIFLY